MAKTKAPKLNKREERVMAIFDDRSECRDGVITTCTHNENMAVRSLERKGLLVVVSCEVIRSPSYTVRGHWTGSHSEECVIKSMRVVV